MKTDINELKKALLLLNIPDEASLIEIKKIYRDLIFRWHPDRCQEDKEICIEKTKEIISSYKLVMVYCDHYKFSFQNSDLEKHFGNTDELEFWYDRFGDDPIWG
jgi:preprotein translocase subunit Sec63